MKKQLKKALKDYFEAPQPQKRNEFLHTVSLQSNPVGNFDFLFIQAFYIRKWVWVFSAFIFAASLISSRYFEKNMLWCISAFMPLLALSMIEESIRSEIYGMEEMEFATRFSLKSVVLARLGILGIANFALICLLIPVFVLNSKMSVFQTGIYLLCPYIITVFIDLWIVRKKRWEKENMYLSIGVASAVSVGNILISQSIPAIYEKQNLIWWCMIALTGGIGTVRQCYKMVKKTEGLEELAWNF